MNFTEYDFLGSECTFCDIMHFYFISKCDRVMPEWLPMIHTLVWTSPLGCRWDVWFASIHEDSKGDRMSLLSLSHVIWCRLERDSPAGLHMLWNAYREVHMAWNYGWPLKPKGSPQPQPIRSQHPQPYGHKEMNPANLKELVSGFFPGMFPDRLVKLWSVDPVTPCPDSWPTETLR